jgi:hypothetical protein
MMSGMVGLARRAGARLDPVSDPQMPDLSDLPRSDSWTHQLGRLVLGLVNLDISKSSI